MVIKLTSIKLLKNKPMGKFVMLLFIVILYSCVKEIPTTHVSGIVVNSGTNQPIDSVSILIQDGVASDNTGSSASKVYITSSNGKFDLEIKSGNPFISAIKKNYRFFNPKGAYEIYPLIAGNTYKLTLKLDAYAFFNPFIKSTQPVSSKDTIIIRIMVYINGKLAPWTGWEHTNIGESIFRYSNGGEGYLAIGDKYQCYKLDFVRNNKWLSKIDSVYIPSLTTYADTIFY
jgi:hypothetical protein